MSNDARRDAPPGRLVTNFGLTTLVASDTYNGKVNPSELLPGLSKPEAVLQMIGIAVFLAIGAAGLGQAPRDERTRVFFLLATMNAAAASVPIVFWWLDITDGLAGGRLPLGVMLACLGVATLALFHFSQVFPRRRAWIRGSGPQLPIAYALTPPAVLLLVRTAPMRGEESSTMFVVLAIAFGFPLIVVQGLVLPIATVVSFLRSMREVPLRRDQPDVRPAIAGFLLSMLLGTALAVLALGPLQAAAPESPATLLVMVTVWLFSLLMPAAFAAAVWKFRLLEIPIDGLSGNAAAAGRTSHHESE